MGIIQKIRKFFNLSLSDPKAWNPSLWQLYSSISESGENVTEETALTYSAFWSAVSLYAGTISALPLHLMQRQGKAKRIAEDQKLYGVMHDRWNNFMTAMTGRKVMIAHILTWGNGYAEKQLNTYGETTALWPIPPNRVVAIEMRGDELWYEIRVDNESIWLPRRNILHIAGLGFDGFIGYSVVSLARKSIGLGMAMETFGSRYFGHGTHLSGVIKHPNAVKDVKALREAFSEVYAGLGNTHRLMLLEEGMEYENIGIPPEDSQFLESRQFQIPEIARWFNLPPHKLKDLTRSSFNNIESEQISFVTDSILPWLVCFEQEYNMQLLTDYQKIQENLYFKHIVEGLLRGNSRERAEYYRTMISYGIMTPNEVREKEDLNPSTDPLADELWMPTGQIPLSKFTEYLAKNTGKNTEGKENEDEPEPVQATRSLITLQNRE